MADFVLEEAGVSLQSFSELSDAVADLQQLHGVAVMVPGRRDVLSTHIKEQELIQTQQTNREGKVRGQRQTAAHRGQRQPEVCGLMLHLDLDLVEESLDPLLLEAAPDGGGHTDLQCVCVCVRALHKHVSALERHLLDDAVDGVADDRLDSLRVLLCYPLQADTERRLLGAAVVPAEQTRHLLQGR